MAGQGNRSIQDMFLVYLLYVRKTQPNIALMDHQSGHRTSDGLFGDHGRSQRQVSIHHQIVTSPVQILQCFRLVNLQQRHGVHGRDRLPTAQRAHEGRVAGRLGAAYP